MLSFVNCVNYCLDTQKKNKSLSELCLGIKLEFPTISHKVPNMLLLPCTSCLYEVDRIIWTNKKSQSKVSQTQKDITYVLSLSGPSIC